MISTSLNHPSHGRMACTQSTWFMHLGRLILLMPKLIPSQLDCCSFLGRKYQRTLIMIKNAIGATRQRLNVNEPWHLAAGLMGYGQNFPRTNFHISRPTFTDTQHVTQLLFCTIATTLFFCILICTITFALYTIKLYVDSCPLPLISLTAQHSST